MLVWSGSVKSRLPAHCYIFLLSFLPYLANSIYTAAGAARAAILLKTGEFMLRCFGAEIPLTSRTHYVVAGWLALLLTLNTAYAAPASGNTESISLIGEDDWFPYSGLKAGKLQGFAVDVIAAAYAAVNVKVTFQAAPYARCLKLVESGRELGCFDSLNEAKLAGAFHFHQVPIFQAEIGIYAAADSAESGLRASDLRGRRLGLTHGYTYTDVIEKDQSIVREMAPSDYSNLRKLVLKRSDYSLVYTRVVDYLSALYPHELQGKIKQVGTLSVDNLYVSFSKRRPEALRYANLLDQGLLKIRKNGVYARLEQNWKNPTP